MSAIREIVTPMSVRVQGTKRDSEPPTEYTPVHVLAVDDDPESLRAVARILKARGFEVDTASDGKIAQDMICDKHYDYFLFDIKMPILDGKRLYYWLKDEYPQLAEMVMFMTGESMGIETQDFLRETGAAFLIKPFTAGELKAKLRELFKD